MTTLDTLRAGMRGKRVARKAISEPIYLSESPSRTLSSRATRKPRILQITTHRIEADEWSTCACGWTSSTTSQRDLEQQAEAHLKWCPA